MTNPRAPAKAGGGAAKVMPSARRHRYGEVLYDRAIGRAPEMESAKAVCELLAGHYAPGMSVLDVGCGCGHYLPSLRRRLDESVVYRGVDAEPYFIERARSAFPDEQDRFEVADANALPYADASFDLVICINMLPNLPPPPRRAVAELIRVAARGVLIRTLFGELSYVVQEIEPGHEAELEQLHAGAGDTCAITYNNIYTESYYRELIRAAAPGLEPRIDPDNAWQHLASTGPGCTRVHGGLQIAGSLVLDWRFITIVKPGAGQ